MTSLKFELAGEFIELHKLLKVVGLCESGGAAKSMIADGGVRVNGAVELRKGCKIRIGQVVALDGATIKVVSPTLD